MNRYYTRVAQRAQRRCEYCHAPEDVFNFHFEVDHILPVALGGTNALTNLALACPACNLYKSNAVAGYDADMQADISLYHPRRDTWSDHFYVDAQSNRIEGLSPTGRATVAQLQINHPIQIAARRLWIEMRLFP